MLNPPSGIQPMYQVDTALLYFARLPFHKDIKCKKIPVSFPHYNEENLQEKCQFQLQVR